MIAIQQSGEVVVVLCRPPWRVPLATPALARAYAELVRRPADGELMALVAGWSDVASLALWSILGQGREDCDRLADEITLAAELVEASWGERVGLAPGPASAG
jgi:hypothetical protein